MLLSRVLLFSACLKVADAGGLRTKEEALDCSKLTSIQIDTFPDFPDIGPLAAILCQFWPSDDLGFGFPLSDVNALVDVANNIFSAKGLWDQFEADAEDQAKAESMYCIRRQTMRPLVAPTGSSCPAVNDDEVKDELATDPDQWESPVLTGSWMCTDSDGETCSCIRGDDPDHQVAEIDPRPEGCEMVHAGVCHGPCPRGYQPTPLLGRLRPVCTSVCGDTHHRFGCGVGCASSIRNCAFIVIRQVKSIGSAVARAHEWALNLTSGNGVGDLASISDALNFVLEWVTTKLHTWVNTMIEQFQDMLRPQQMFVTAFALLIHVEKLGLQDGVEPEEIKDLITSSLDFLMELLNININFSVIDEEWLISTILKHGGNKLLALAKVLGGFHWKSCEIVPVEASFTIEEAGDSRVVGTWLKKGEVEGKPSYVMDGADSQTRLEWNARDLAWKMFVKDTEKGRGRWFGWAGLGWRNLYMSTQDSAAWPTINWERVEGASPIPFLLSVA